MFSSKRGTLRWSDTCSCMSEWRKLCGTNHVQSVGNRWQRNLRLIPCLAPAVGTFGRDRLKPAGEVCTKNLNSGGNRLFKAQLKKAPQSELKLDWRSLLFLNGSSLRQN